MERGQKVWLRSGSEDKRVSVEMPPATFSKGHSDTEKKLETLQDVW